MTGPLRVVGLDLSLTSTGMSDGRTHAAFGTGPDMRIEARLMHIRDTALSFVLGLFDEPCADLVVIEGGAFARGAQSKAAEDLAGLRYVVRCALATIGVPFAMVPPSTLKRYTTGHGQATKAQMVAAVAERHGVDLSAVKVKDGRYDQADAFALAAMGYTYVGQPLPSVGPPGPRASLLAIDWPDSATALQSRNV